jgi:hypothetical protein
MGIIEVMSDIEILKNEIAFLKKLVKEIKFKCHNREYITMATKLKGNHRKSFNIQTIIPKDASTNNINHYFIYEKNENTKRLLRKLRWNLFLLWIEKNKTIITIILTIITIILTIIGFILSIII